MVELEVHIVWKRKITICSIYLPPTDQISEKSMKNFLEQRITLIILMKNFYAHNPLYKNEKKNKHERENAREDTRQIQPLVLE